MKAFKRNSLLSWVFLQVAIFATSLHADTAIPAPKVVCFGDSITKRGYPEIMGELYRLQVINSGVAGHSSKAGLKRFEKDVLAHTPKLAVIFFGTNDIRVDAPHAYVPLEDYRANLLAMIQGCQEAEIEVVLCTPSPIHEETYYERHSREVFGEHGGIINLLDTYAAEVRTLAKENELSLVDLRRLLEGKDWMHPDGVHPSEKGCGIIAKLIGEVVSKELASGK